jgi:ribosomal-protein-alanine N-acetyltransferase
MARNPFRRRQFEIEPASVSDARALADLHREDFVRPWTDGEFATLLEQSAVFGFIARESGNPAAAPGGFVLARLAADEAEILTVAVASSLRRRGIGRRLMEAVLRHLHRERAATLFLEVDSRNAAAIALYLGLGFRRAGMRPDYYETAASGRSPALVLRRDLR